MAVPGTAVAPVHPVMVQVDDAVLAAIRAELTDAADALEDCAPSVPGTVDGGLLAAMLAEILADAVQAAGEVAAALSATAAAVAEAGDDYRSTDTDIAGALGVPVRVR